MDKHARCVEEGCQVKEAKGYRDCEQSSGICNLLDCSPEAQLYNTAVIALSKLTTLEAHLPNTPTGDDLAGGCGAIRAVLEEVIKRGRGVSAGERTPHADLINKLWERAKSLPQEHRYMGGTAHLLLEAAEALSARSSGALTESDKDLAALLRLLAEVELPTWACESVGTVSLRLRARYLAAKADPEIPATTSAPPAARLAFDEAAWQSFRQANGYPDTERYRQGYTAALEEGDRFAAMIQAALPSAAPAEQAPVGEPPVIFSAGSWTYDGDGRAYDSRELDAAAWNKLGRPVSATARTTDAEVAELREKLAAYEGPAKRRERMGEIVAFLFPQYDGRRGRPEGMLIHPEKSWWWNGASIDENKVELSSKGSSASCTVQSYIGSNEYESFDLDIPAEWMDADDFKPLASKWINEETARRAEEKRKNEIAQAETDAQDAERRLAALRRTDRQAESS